MHACRGRALVREIPLPEADAEKPQACTHRLTKYNKKRQACTIKFVFYFYRITSPHAAMQPKYCQNKCII